MNDELLETIKKEVAEEIKKRKRNGSYASNQFKEIRDFVLQQNISNNDPEYATYKSAVSSHFAKRSHHAAATLLQRKRTVFSEEEEKILRDLKEEERLRDVYHHLEELVGSGIH